MVHLGVPSFSSVWGSNKQGHSGAGGIKSQGKGGKSARRDDSEDDDDDDDEDDEDARPRRSARVAYEEDSD